MINISLGRSTGKHASRATADEEENERGRGGGGEEDEDEPMADSIGDLGGAAGEEADGKPDVAWLQAVKEEEKKEILRTDVELRGYMSNLIKESIRVSIIACFPLI